MYRVYLLKNGCFATMPVLASAPLHTESWLITADQNILVENGADLFIENGSLVISYFIEDMPFAEVIE